METFLTADGMSILNTGINGISLFLLRSALVALQAIRIETERVSVKVSNEKPN